MTNFDLGLGKENAQNGASVSTRHIAAIAAGLHAG